MDLTAAETVFWSAAGAFWGPDSGGNRVLERYRSVLWTPQQQKQRSGALQERSGALAAAGTASWSATGAFCGPDSSTNSVLERLQGCYVDLTVAGDRCRGVTRPKPAETPY